MSREPVHNRFVAVRQSPQLSLYRDTVDLYLGQDNSTRETFSYAVATDIVFRAYTKEDEGKTDHTPLLRLTTTEAQVLIDSLWDCGLRPSEGSGSAGAMLATQEHLKDAQKEIEWLRASVHRLLSQLTKGDSA